MGKIIFWIVVGFGFLLGLRLLNVAAARRRQRRSRPAKTGATVPMVRCHRCGVFLPRTDAREQDGSFTCSDPRCRSAR